MIEAFEILQFSMMNPDTPLPETINILNNWDGVTEEVLARHIYFLRRFGQVSDVQNLYWTLELLENLCEESLHN